MSFKRISISQGYKYNESAHIYSYKYGWINKIVHFFLDTFVKETKLPFIAIFLFILVIVLNSVQYYNNDKYLQTQIKDTISKEPDSTSFQNIILYIYDMMGINGFNSFGLGIILLFILTYICVALIEMNIGHIKVLYFLIVCLMFQYFEGGLSASVCLNNQYGCLDLGNTPYCCGSFITYASLGFVLFIIQKNISSLYKKLLVWFIIGCVWGGCVLGDYYIKSAYGDMEEGNRKNCRIFFWHATNFLLGVFSGLVLAN